jgi:phosphomannomutase
LGIQRAVCIGATSVVTPVSSNTALERTSQFAACRLARIRIGSPYVIAAMAEELAAGSARAFGNESNGSFLLGSRMPCVAAVVGQAVPTRDTDAKIALQKTPLFGGVAGEAASLVLTNGVRATFDSGAVIHLRPSCNAPQMYCQIDAHSEAEALVTNRQPMAAVQALLQVGGLIFSAIAVPVSPETMWPDDHSDTTHSTTELSALVVSAVRVTAPLLVAIGADPSAACSSCGM